MVVTAFSWNEPAPHFMLEVSLGWSQFSAVHMIIVGLDIFAVMKFSRFSRSGPSAKI